ncbi:SseB family protein [Aquicoccus sp. G2-2]|uniref:SseB family protein n=1 Tax=Aquicoccus sp. G2-2 TaxID=3092120 RepID=UPI002AE06444|nr:SseB family protein [Aquicoccus sp. G2-2]MEA1112443.1 SseB family protein [Aquicoccus sp. G2-2]
MTQTLLDLAHAAMQAAPDDPAARLRFYERVADSELFVLLSREAAGDQLEPELFELDGGRYLLAFDRQERMAEFVGKPAPYAGLSGRALVHMLTGQGIGMALNPEVAPSSILLPPEALNWLGETLTPAPKEAEGMVREMRPPRLPEPVLAALDGKLAQAGGLAKMAALVQVQYDDGHEAHLLGLIGAAPGAEGALAKAVNEALVFSGAEAETLDVGFFAPDSAMAERLARVGLRFDLPGPDLAATGGPTAPGMDAANPPKLR